MSKWCIFKCDRCGNEEKRGEGWSIICYNCKNNGIEETMKPYKWECYNGHQNYVRGFGFSAFDICEKCERMELNNREDNSFRKNKNNDSNNICLPFFGNKKGNKKDNDCCNIY